MSVAPKRFSLLDRILVPIENAWEYLLSLLPESLLYVLRLLFGYVKQGFRYCMKVFPKALCILDDIPFLLLKADSGVFFLVGAGFLIFPFLIYEGIKGLLKAFKSGDDLFFFKAAASTAIIIGGVAGMAVTSALLVLTLNGILFAAGITSIGIPAIMAVVAGIELLEEIHGYIHAANESEERKAKLKIFMNTIFLGISLAVTAFAALSVMSSLGVLSLGTMPAIVLITIVSASVVLKIFEIVDKKYDYKMTNAIRSLFCSETSCDNEPGMTNNAGLTKELIRKGQPVKKSENDTKIELQPRRQKQGGTYPGLRKFSSPNQAISPVETKSSSNYIGCWPKF